ncbi:hypothetical protein B0H19DRAFT_1195544 [Mycena capillaripes]|nr:hypothetical protein B0H19DRAFT_1195544 [Mycena capillaripes]
MLIVVVYLYLSSMAIFALDLAWWSRKIQARLMTPDIPIQDRADLRSDWDGFVFPPLEILRVLSVCVNRCMSCLIDAQQEIDANWGQYHCLARMGRVSREVFDALCPLHYAVRDICEGIWGFHLV